MKYRNRQEAGRVLAEALRSYANKKNVLVLALPRGGVPVAYEVADSLNAPLDVFIVRKLGVPGHKELALGAIASGDVEIFNEDIISHLSISPAEIAEVIRLEKNELARRHQVYRGNLPLKDIHNSLVILVDDGIATGATMRAAIKALRLLNPKELIVAVPVADKNMVQKITPLVDAIFCPLQPDELQAVGAWYDDFTQTEDEEVHALLKAAAAIH